MRRPSATAVVSLVTVSGATLFVLAQLHPSLLLADTTPAGGDMGAHVWGPAYLRDHLLPHGRLTGWTPDWYAGFPALTFYFPLPSLAIVLADLLLPYNVAFKLVSVLGVLTLPVAAWAFGRLVGLKGVGPACLAAATVPFLFDRSFTIYGGNIPSTLAGEFAFSISLSLALVFLGVVARGLETGGHRALAALLLGLTGLCHVIPTFFALAGLGVLLLLRPSLHRLRFVLITGAVAAALAAFWILPFLARLPYTNDMGWEKIVTYRKALFPADLRWVMALAGIGVGASVYARSRTGAFLVAMAAVSAAAFVLAPQGRLWNARLLPFWFLCLYLLAGLAVAEIGGALAHLLGRRSSGTAVAAEAATALVAVCGALVVVALPLQALPGWVPLSTTDRSFVPDWVRWNYSGYERKPAWPEYRDLVATMRGLPCGRAMWEYEPELDRLGTPMALMLLPYWTDGCIGSMEGLFFESSATTPYHFLNQSELSARPSRAQRDLPYRNLDVAHGLAHLQLLGVRYYLALSPEAQAQARSHPQLRLIATSGPWTVDYPAPTGPQPRTWEVYEVDGARQVVPLGNEPVVMTGVAKGGEEWLDAAVGWYQDESRWDVALAASGPRRWERVRGADADPPRREVAAARVSRVRTADDRISFDVDRTGTPVLVKSSYFPNWKASGADGPWRVTPNLMVVVPTARHVELHYGWTPVDVAGYVLTLLGVVGVGWLWRRERRERQPGPPGEGTEPGPPAETTEDELDRELAAVLAGEVPPGPPRAAAPPAGRPPTGSLAPSDPDPGGPPERQ